MSSFEKTKYIVAECSFSKVSFSKADDKFPLKVAMSVTPGWNETQSNVFAAKVTTNIKSDHLPFDFTISIEIQFTSEDSTFEQFSEWANSSDGQSKIEIIVSEVIDSMLNSFGYPPLKLSEQ